MWECWCSVDNDDFTSITRHGLGDADADPDTNYLSNYVFKSLRFNTDIDDSDNEWFNSTSQSWMDLSIID